MDSTIAALITVAVLAGWHVRTRRQASWAVSSKGRTFVLTGYFAVAIGVYWLVGAPTATGWEWLVGNLWTLGAMTSFVYGFEALQASLAGRPQVGDVARGNRNPFAVGGDDQTSGAVEVDCRPHDPLTAG